MKKIICLLLILTLVFNAFTFVSAEEHKQPKVVIQGIENIPGNIIQDIIKENPNAGQITILEYKKCSEDESMSVKNKNTEAVMGAYNSRTYKVKFYAQKGTYTAKSSTGTIGFGTLKFGDESDNFTEPSYYISYCSDIYVN